MTSVRNAGTLEPITTGRAIGLLADRHVKAITTLALAEDSPNNPKANDPKLCISSLPRLRLGHAIPQPRRRKHGAAGLLWLLLSEMMSDGKPELQLSAYFGRGDLSVKADNKK